MRLMMGRLGHKKLAHHCVVPVSSSAKYSSDSVPNALEVLGCSWMGPQHGRILISYIEGDDLVVGYSKLYDFRARNDRALELFARWLLCSACGITRENQKLLRSNS